MGEVTGPPRAGGSGAVILHAPPIPLPDPHTLATAQVCGRACVWCSTALDNTTAVDLGERSADDRGTPRWFPRCCRPCGFHKIYVALLDHTQSCKQCAIDFARCIDGKALRMAMRAVR